MTDTQKWFAVGATAILAGLLYLLAPVLAPFLAATLIAYAVNPLVARLQTLGLARVAAVIVVFSGLALTVVVMLLVLVPLLERQLVRLVHNLPAYIDRVQVWLLPWLRDQFQIEDDFSILESLKRVISEHWQGVGGIAAGLLQSVAQSGLVLLGWMINLTLIPVVIFYLLRDWDALLARLRVLLPRAVEPTVLRLARECDEVLGAFFRGQLMVMLALSFIYTFGLWWVGLDLALLIGIGAGVLSFVPYLGLAVGLAVAALAAGLQFQDVLHPLLVMGVFSVGQMLESMILTPVLVGERIGLHPVVVIFAVMVGGQLFGFSGMLLALPVAAVALVFLHDAQRRYLASKAYGGD